MLVENKYIASSGVVEAAERLLAHDALSRRGAARIAEKASSGLPCADSRRFETAPGQALIHVRKFTLRRGSFMSLDGVSFSIAKGQVTALCGPCGCGMAAMLDALGCTLPGAHGVDMAGSIELSGHDLYRAVDPERAREQVARLFFDDSIELQSVRNAIALSARFRGVHEKAAVDFEVDRALRLTGTENRLGDKLDCAVRSLPPLERRLVALARAVAKRPRAVLVFEPVRGLSAADALAMTRALQSVACKAECAVVVATSDARFVREVADSCVVFLQGRVVEVGPTAKVVSPAADYRARAFFEGRIA